MIEEETQKEQPPRKKFMIFMPTYKTKRTIEAVFRRIPEELLERVDRIVACDNASGDGTYEEIERVKEELNLDKLTILQNEKNLGFGGNIKRGVKYAVDHNYDIIAMLHSDGQYPPERVLDLIQPIEDDRAEAVSGSRFISDPRQGGMPNWRFFGNRVLTTIQNSLLGLKLSEWHTGFRAYNVKALKSVPFQRCENGYEWTTDIFIFLLLRESRFAEIAIPAHYAEDSTSPSLTRTFTYGLGTLKLTFFYVLNKIGFKNKYSFPDEFTMIAPESKGCSAAKDREEDE